jgi:arylsulfatase A-like enzyme
MLGVAGSQAPDYAHGASLVPWLDGETPPWREASYEQTTTRYEEHNQRCLRTESWKLVIGESGPNHLYDLVHDPEEENNLYRAPLMDGEQPPSFPSHAHVIEPLVHALAHTARAFGDEVGVRAAERALAELASRGERGAEAPPG